MPRHTSANLHRYYMASPPPPPLLFFFFFARIPLYLTEFYNADRYLGKIFIFKLAGSEIFALCAKVNSRSVRAQINAGMPRLGAVGRRPLRAGRSVSRTPPQVGARGLGGLARLPSTARDPRCGPPNFPAPSQSS